MCSFVQETVSVDRDIERSRTMADETNERLKATGEQIKGKAQKAWSELTDDEKMKAKGEMNEAKGNLRHDKEDAKDAAEKIADRHMP
jgi:uncharacterized protein YjbJ (UPF0337 family)